MTRLETILNDLQEKGHHIVNTGEETTLIGLTTDMAQDEEFGNRDWTTEEVAIGLNKIEDGEELVWITSSGANQDLMTLLAAIDQTGRATETQIQIDEHGHAYGIEITEMLPETDYGMMLMSIYLIIGGKVDYGMGEKKPYREGIELLLA